MAYRKIEDILKAVNTNEITGAEVKFELYKRLPSMFINETVYIEDRDIPGSVARFKLWPEQEKALETFINHNRVIVLKARQLGLTWLALAYAVNMIVFNSGKSVATISQTEDDSKELVRRVQFILRHLPKWLIVHKNDPDEEKQKNVTGIWWEGSTLTATIHHPDAEPSTFKGFTSSPGAARSFTANLIILDEWAFHPMATKIWTAAYPTINRPTGGQVIGISTGEMGTLFEEIWNNADWEYAGAKGAAKNNFKGIFLPWNADPRRNREWYEQTKEDLPNTYRAEYPATPAEAFTVGEGAMFDEWDRDIHIVYGKDWYPPDDWRIVLAYDGGYNRAAAIWFAISNDGWAIAYREYYPYKKIDPEQAEDIRALSRDPNGVPERIDYIVADTSCWAKNKDTGKSTVEIFNEHGLRPMRKADKDRIMGWKRLHEWLKPITDEEGNVIEDRFGQPLAKLRFTTACPNTIRLFPGLKADEHKPDDLAPGQEDHLADCCRYFAMSRPRAKRSEKEEKNIRERRRRLIKPRSSVTGY